MYMSWLIPVIHLFFQKLWSKSKIMLNSTSHFCSKVSSPGMNKNNVKISVVSFIFYNNLGVHNLNIFEQIGCLSSKTNKGSIISYKYVFHDNHSTCRRFIMHENAGTQNYNIEAKRSPWGLFGIQPYFSEIGHYWLCWLAGRS